MNETTEVPTAAPSPERLKLIERVSSDFTYHAPKPGQPEVYEHLRETAKSLAMLIIVRVPPGREQSLALTNLEEAIFWANAGIARHGS